MGEEGTGQDEERDRHDLEALEAGKQLERHRFGRHFGEREHEGQHGQTERDRHRHAGEHQRDQQPEQDQAAQPLRKRNEMGFVRETYRHDKQRDENDDQPERTRIIGASRARDRLGVKIVFFDALDVAAVMVRQLPGPEEPPSDLQEAEAHQSGAERNRGKDDPHSHFKIVRPDAGVIDLPDKGAAEDRYRSGEQRAAQQAEDDHALARRRPQHVDENVDADMDAGAHAIGGAELGHPDEHVDAQLLRPGDVDRAEPTEDAEQQRRQQRQAVRGRPFRQVDRSAGAVAVQHSEENQDRRRRDQRRDQPLLEMIECAQNQARDPPSRDAAGSWLNSRPFLLFLTHQIAVSSS